jgi:hypothetical protein
MKKKGVVGLIDFADIYTTGQIVRGMATGQVGPVAAGATAKLTAAYLKLKSSPHRLVKNMFSEVDKLQGKTPKSAAPGMASLAISTQIDKEEDKD